MPEEDALRTALATLSEDALCDLIERMPAGELARLRDLCDYTGCDCEIDLSRDNLGLVMAGRCPHTADAGGWVLPPRALELLCRRLAPHLYVEPPPPAEPMLCLVQDARLGVMMDRSRRRVGLHHPDDLRAEDVARLGRRVAQADHGSGRGRLKIGEVFAEGQEEELDDEDLADEAQADRFAATRAAGAANRAARATILPFPDRSQESGVRSQEG